MPGNISIDEQVRKLLDQMTPDEKIDQLCKVRGFEQYESDGTHVTLSSHFMKAAAKHSFGTIYGIMRADWWTKRDFANGITPRAVEDTVSIFQNAVMDGKKIKIPALLVEEAPHGLMALGTTVFPTGIGMGSSFDPDLLLRIGKVIGKEAYSAGIRSVYAPILDIAWDPRWSRVEECFSENPFVVAVLGKKMTEGLLAEGVNPTMKHFVGGGHSEGGHNQATVHLGPMELYNYDLLPFRECINAGAKFLMPTYHDIDGEMCIGSPILQKILREHLGFDGFATADAGAVGRLKSFRICTTDAEAAARALKTGCDGESGQRTIDDCGKFLRQAYQEKLINDADLDIAAGRMLKQKLEMGICDHPGAFGKPEEVFGCPEHRAVALEAAEKSLVLLKNDDQTLPIRDTIRKIALIGPNADHKMNMLGDYTAPQLPQDVITVYESMKAECEKRGITLRYAHGCWIRRKDRSGFAEALEAARESDLIVFVPGGSSTRYGDVKIDPVTGAALPPEIFDADTCEKEGGEGTDRATLNFSGVQMELFRELAALGKPIVTVPIAGRPLLVEECLNGSAALIYAWYPGMCGGKAIANALFGKISPAGRLPVSLPRSEGQLPVHCMTAGRSAYCDADPTPLFPFGYGLSYTEFTYSDLTVNGRTVSVCVTNTGSYESDEVVLFYLQVQKFPFIRPEKELFAFRRIHLKIGESMVVSAELTDECLGRYDREGKFVMSPAECRIFAGPDLCREIRIS